jgi:hypothetical protein
MRAILAFVGAGSALRAVFDWGLGFFAAAAALAAWRRCATPLRKIELALVALCGLAALARPIDAALAAAVFLAALKLMRIM